MKRWQKQLLTLVAACLWSLPGLAADQAALTGEEAKLQIRVLTSQWQTQYPEYIKPVTAYAVTDLDGDGRLEILSKPYASDKTPTIYEVNARKDGLEKKDKKWHKKHFQGQRIAWFALHPEIAAAAWQGRTAQVNGMLRESYEIYAGHQEAFG